MNAFMASAQSGDVPIVKYFLDRGGDLMKVDDKGRTVLHHAVSAGALLTNTFTYSFCNQSGCNSNHVLYNQCVHCLWTFDLRNHLVHHRML
jgi:ankyrin repeat protein